MKMLHCSDLHLSVTEKEYSFSVLREIVEKTIDAKAELLVFAGDVFDSFQDAEALASEFREQVKPLTCEVLLLPGNHDISGSSIAGFSAIDLGPKVIPLTKLPFGIFEKCGVEFLSIPFQRSLKDYVDWPVPPKGAGKHRVLIAHGTVDDMVFCMGQDEQSEKDDGAMDLDVFTRFQADYVAMGHIHGRRFKKSGSLEIHYPGSARVWRQNEVDARGFNLVEINSSVSVQFKELKSAGQFYSYQIPVELDGSIKVLSEVSALWGPNDWVKIECTGIVEDQNTVAQSEELLREEFQPRVRQFDIDHPHLGSVAGIASHPLAKQFLTIWKEKEPAQGQDQKVWLKARELGLMAIKEELDKRNDQ